MKYNLAFFFLNSATVLEDPMPLYSSSGGFSVISTLKLSLPLLSDCCNLSNNRQILIVLTYVLHLSHFFSAFPLFLRHREFHLQAFFGMVLFTCRKTWKILRHFVSFMSSSTELCFACLQRSSFLILQATTSSRIFTDIYLYFDLVCYRI